MNIVFLSRLYLPHVGGVETHLFEICKILSARHHISIITEQHDSTLPLFEQTEVGDVYRLPIGNVSEKQKKWVIWRGMIAYFNLLKSADVVHVHDVFFWYLPFRLLFPNKKVYITYHGYEGVNAPGIKQVFWHKLAEALTRRNICVAEYQAKWYHVHPTFVTYGGVNEVPTVTGQKKSGAVFIGRLSADASIMEYLQAVKQLKIPLDIYGDGPDRQKAEKFVLQHHLPVQFFGLVPFASQFLPNYKIAFVSRYLGILESLIAKVPVVSHYNNEIKKDSLQMSKLAEYIWIAGSVDEIVAYSKQILDNSTGVLPKAKAGYQYAKNQTWSQVAHIYEQLWRL